MESKPTESSRSINSSYDNSNATSCVSYVTSGVSNATSCVILGFDERVLEDLYV